MIRGRDTASFWPPLSRARADWLYGLVSLVLLAAATGYAIARSETGDFLKVASNYSAIALLLIVTALVLGTMLGAVRMQRDRTLAKLGPGTADARPERSARFGAPAAPRLNRQRSGSAASRPSAAPSR